MAETETGVMNRQAFAKPLPDIEVLKNKSASGQ